MTPYQLAAIKAGLEPDATDAQRRLGRRQIGLIEDEVLAHMTIEEAKEWVRLVSAPIALNAERARRETAENELARIQIEFLRRQS